MTQTANPGYDCLACRLRRVIREHVDGGGCPRAVIECLAVVKAEVFAGATDDRARVKAEELFRGWFDERAAELRSGAAGRLH